jgi:hypothetical protein
MYPPSPRISIPGLSATLLETDWPGYQKSRWRPPPPVRLMTVSGKSVGWSWISCWRLSSPPWRGSISRATRPPREGCPCRWRRVSLHPSGDRARVECRPQGQMGDDVAHLPAGTGTGVVPRRCGEGVEVVRELLCCGLAQLDTVRSCVHGLLLCGGVSPRRQRQGNFGPRTSRTEHGPAIRCLTPPCRMPWPPVSIAHPRRAPQTAYRRRTHRLTVLLWHGAVLVALRVYKTARGRRTRLRRGKDGSRPHHTPSGRFVRLPAAAQLLERHRRCPIPYRWRGRWRASQHGESSGHAGLTSACPANDQPC